MALTHTPGPWRYRHAVGGKRQIGADVHGPDGFFVADCGSHEQADENAQLIAAAPEMLTLLRRIAREALEQPGGVYLVPVSVLSAVDRFLGAVDSRPEARPEGRV